MSTPECGPCQVPPGFRFHPTDEELVNYYLRKKVALEKFDLDVIRDVDLNKLEPWDLHERCRIDSTTQNEWYFFSHKDKKYPTGSRTNRATSAGFWKATGRDKAVHSSYKRIGMRKTLVFYTGRAPHGQKTDWIMHEYRLDDCETDIRGNEDGWVVCRVFKKRIHHQKSGQECQTFASEEEQTGPIESKSAYCKSFQKEGTSVAVNIPFLCKQEVEFEEHLPQVPFLHLPQLESPKNIFSNVSDHGRRAFSESYCKRSEFPSLFSTLEMPPLEGCYSAKSFIFGCEEDITDGFGQSEWSVLAETIPKEMIMKSNLDNVSNFSDLAALPLLNAASRASQQQAADQHYPVPSCEVDLWNFIR